MGWTYIAAASGNYWSNAATQDCSSTLNVAAGDLLVAVVGFRSAATITSVADTGGGNSMTLTSVSTQDVERMAMGYKIAADANATSTFRLTLSGSALNPSIIVMQFRPDSGETVTLDAGPAAASGAGDAAQTADFTTSGTDEVVVAGLAKHYHSALSAFQIGDSAVTGSQAGGDQYDTWACYRMCTGTNIHAQETVGWSNWIMMALSFKSTASSGGTESLSGSVTASASTANDFLSRYRYQMAPAVSGVATTPNTFLSRIRYQMMQAVAGVATTVANLTELTGSIIETMSVAVTAVASTVGMIFRYRFDSTNVSAAANTTGMIYRYRFAQVIATAAATTWANLVELGAAAARHFRVYMRIGRGRF